VRVFKNTWFARFAGKEGITDGELREAVNQLESGRADANLGGGVYKVRVARPDEGKSGGYRVIVFFRSKERTFYAYGFAKSDRSNISQKELKKLKKQAKSLMSMSEDRIVTALKEGVLIEIEENCHEREISI
jgi:hypothetical protein